MKSHSLTAVLLALILSLCSFQPLAGEPDSQAEREKRARAYFGDDLLIDQDGVSKRFFSDWLNGRIVLLNFVFTQCRDACPLLTQKLRSVRQDLGNDFGRKVFFLSLTVDPAHDTPDKLKAFAQKMHADEAGWRFLTAEPTAMQKVQQRLGQFQAEPEQHSTLLLAGNPGRGHWIKIRPDSPAAAIAAKIQLLLNEL